MNMAGVNRLSTHEIMRISRDTYNNISSTAQCVDLSTLQKFFDSNQFGLSDDQIKDVELAILLISSAHEVSENHFDDARKLLNLCDFLSSCRGNSVQRVVYYFTKALQARISQETGIISSDSGEKKTLLSFQPTIVKPNIILSCVKLPGIQIAQFAAIQATLDSLQSAKNVHIIDLAIRSGEHCSVLMQALANRHECPTELLKITAVGISETQQKIEEVGKLLTSFAETLHLSFQFSAAIIEDVKYLRTEIFKTSEDEAVAVVSLLGLRKIIAIPDHYLESLLTVLRTLTPRVFVIVEHEAKHNSAVFIERFLEALISYSASYDCIEDCIGKEVENRLAMESILGQEIKDIVTAKDEGRIYRHMSINEWRDYFTELGIAEVEMGVSCFNQATLQVKNFGFVKACFLMKNGKCLVTGWKGIPLLSVSAWKFQQGMPKGSKVCLRDNYLSDLQQNIVNLDEKKVL